MAKRITADELVLCATNEGGLYDGQKHLARYTLANGRAGMDVWAAHVKECVLPYLMVHGCYKGETITMSRDETARATKLLRQYYECHVRECTADA